VAYTAVHAERDLRAQAIQMLYKQQRPGTRVGDYRISRCGVSVGKVNTETGKTDTVAVLAPGPVVFTVDEKIRDYILEQIGGRAILVKSFSVEDIQRAATGQKGREAAKWMTGR